MATRGKTDRVYVTAPDAGQLYELALVPGNPGTWSTVSVTAAPLSSTTGIDYSLCDEWVFSDDSSDTVVVMDDTFAPKYQFNANLDSNPSNIGVTILPGGPTKIWTIDSSTSAINIFNGQSSCFESGNCPTSWLQAVNHILLGNNKK